MVLDNIMNFEEFRKFVENELWPSVRPTMGAGKAREWYLTLRKIKDPNTLMAFVEKTSDETIFTLIEKFKLQKLEREKPKVLVISTKQIHKISWLTKEYLKQELVWALDVYASKEIVDIFGDAIEERADILYNPKPLYEDLPPLHLNYLNQDSITKEDPFLNYVLKHEIPDGYERNAVVFKNLAPILVALKLDNDNKILNSIIKNCPGKTMGELMGWINRARRGELHLNKFEIEKWSNKHGII